MTDLTEIEENLRMFCRAKGYDADITPINNKAMPFVQFTHYCRSLDEYKDAIAHIAQMSYHSVVCYSMEQPREV